eukprot:335884_1
MVEINYNNFISNKINLKNTNNINQNAQTANYNYFGSSDQAIVMNKIEDICFDVSVGAVIWWPFLVNIFYNISHFDNKTNTINVTDAKCFGSNYRSHNVSINVMPIYFYTSFNIYASGSPYYILDNVLISNQIEINIEQGTELIFTNDYTINIDGGRLNLGCNTTFVSNNFLSNTNNDGIRGLYNNSTVIYVHANDTSNNVYKGSIRITKKNTSKLFSCNVLFEDLAYLVLMDESYLYPNTIYIDHSEINNINNGIYHSSIGNLNNNEFPLLFTITNSHFNNINNRVVSYIGGYIDSCIFENLFGAHPASIIGWPLQIYNSIISGNSKLANVPCIKTTDAGADITKFKDIIENNVFENCDIGIFIMKTQPTACCDVEIKYNTFRNNILAINFNSFYVNAA